MTTASRARDEGHALHHIVDRLRGQRTMCRSDGSAPMPPKNRDASRDIALAAASTQRSQLEVAIRGFGRGRLTLRTRHRQEMEPPMSTIDAPRTRPALWRTMGFWLASATVVACATGPQRPFLDLSAIAPGDGFFCTVGTGAGPVWSRCHRSEAECVAVRHENTRQGPCERAPVAWCLATFEGAASPTNIQNVCMTSQEECSDLSRRGHDYRSAIDATTCIQAR